MKSNTSPRAALLLSFLERYTMFVVYAASNIVLSRILTPHDTGLFTLGFALTVMIGTLRDFGVSTYILQEADLTDIRWRSAFGVSAVTCAIVMAGVVIASLVAGRVYGDPDVTKVMLISGLTLLLIPFNSIMTAWLRREMHYGSLYRISLLGGLGQVSVTIILAYGGQGAMSMAWGSVANAVLTAVAGIRLRPRQFGYRPTLAGWRPIAGLGFYSTVGTVCSEVKPNSANVFLGRYAGVAQLGLFSKGGSLPSLVFQSLINAALPVASSVFAQQRREGGQLDQAFPQSLTLFSGMVWPAFAGLAVVSAPAIRLMFGPQWEAAIPPAPLLAIGAMVSALTALHGAVFQAFGAMRARMMVQLWVTPFQLVVLFVAAHGTLVQMAAGTVFTAAIEFLPSQITVNRLCGMRMRPVLLSLLPSAVVAACTAFGALAAGAMLPSTPDLMVAPLLLALALGAVGWLAGLALTRHPLRGELLRATRAVQGRFGRRVAPS